MKRPHPSVVQVFPLRAAELPPSIVDECMDNSKEAIIVADMRLADAPLCFVNNAFVDITGYSRQEAIGRNCNYLQGTDRKQPEVKLIRQAIKAKQPLEVTLRNYRKDGTLFYNRLRLLPARDASGFISHYIGFVEDVSEQHDAEVTIGRLSFVDQTTGVLNRGAFSEQIRIASKADRSEMVIVRVDIVGFHDINNGFGHDVGDSLLRAVAKRLTKTNAFAVGRMGANEFALAFRAKTSDQADNIAADTVQLASEAYQLEEILLSPRFSSGCAFGIPETDGTYLIRKAGSALHRSKRSTSRELNVFTVDDDSEARRRIRLTTELKQAIKNNEFLLHFQPKVDLRTLRIVGAEALIRWQHPILGLQLPGLFISHAEEVGLIGDIDEWGLKTAARFCKMVNRRSEHPITISCNISGQEIMEPGKLDRIMRMCEQEEVDPRLIILELTESVIVTSGSAAMDRLKEIRKLGFGLAIDDFGTGYSNLRYIEELPFSEIKIDRSFVTDLDRSPTKRIIVEALIKLGQQTGIDIVAEGIETEREFATLKELGCGYGQGYLFRRQAVTNSLCAWLVPRASDPAS
ncbi:diguanylate cyclase (GGDEF)-like protein/PAS domain S-box-containing protein [Rhodoligotrophos appendicifer]|uniref:putative bifunctional diguanylate cyclase/phosphodiesterase n=1 Tax=Rhodoligotrophos appendicifer TaxID=987056 RepID=UPI0011863250|nr:bifunctional diguanylate cyclase/phosphodiesterase [Rhodoligotrophos appendicifer]